MKNIPFEELRSDYKIDSAANGLKYLEDWVNKNPDVTDLTIESLGLNDPNLPDSLKIDIILTVCLALTPEFLTTVYKLRAENGELRPEEYNSIEDIPDGLGNLDLYVIHRRK